MIDSTGFAPSREDSGIVDGNGSGHVRRADFGNDARTRLNPEWHTQTHRVPFDEGNSGFSFPSA
jgi:hypothetical protein